LAVLARGKELNKQNCHWMRAFNNVKKHKMLQLKTCSSIRLQPAFYDKRRTEDLLKVNLTIHKLKAYIEKLKSSGRSLNSYGNEQSEALNELFSINELAKKMQSDYVKDFFKNITKSFYQQ
jgi:hypothetical protein